MFLVEPESGQRCHYASARALGAAIRRGELGPQARIFHQTTNQWLSITVHPEYRRAESDWEEGSARRLSGRRWTFFPAGAREGGRDTSALSAQAQPEAGPVRTSGEAGSSWLGSAFRHLRQLAGHKH